MGNNVALEKDDTNLDFTVSVVIPAYNAGRYVGRALDSVLAQTLPAHEIIVVDDGSTDDTEAVVKSYGEQVCYICQGNAGASAARNAGIEAATGTWIAFLDADDEWLPGKLEAQIGLLKRNRALVWTSANFDQCFCGENRRKENLAESAGAKLLEGKEYFDEYFRAFVCGATGWTGTMLIKREVLYDAGLFRVGQLNANDLDMWWRIAYRRPQIGYNDKSLAVYHTNIQRSITKLHRDPILLKHLLERHLPLAAEHGRLEQFRPCARFMLRYWIHHYLFDERIYKVRELVVAFDDLLPSFYKSILRLLTLWPGLTLRCMPILSLINRWVGLKI